MKKVMLAAMGLVCLLMVGKVQADCTGTIFSDVSQASVGYSMCDYIERFSVLGITSGYPDGTYRPGSSVTRGQMAAFVMRAIDNVVQSQIKVFDANDQYLGNLIDMGDTCLKVFIPSLQKVICLSPFDGGIPYEHSLVFASANCTGQSYVTEASIMFRIVRNAEKYFTATGSMPELVNFQSSQHEGVCSSINWQNYAAPVYEVALPFSLPVALPMRLE